MRPFFRAVSLRSTLSICWALTALSIDGQEKSQISFDVTSVKLNNSDPRLRQPAIGCSHGRFTSRAGAGFRPIVWAYGVDYEHILNLPEWASMGPEVYDIQAVAEGNISDDQCKAMVRTLLADRFKLRAHWEEKPRPVFALVVAKNGPKMNRATESDPANSEDVRVDGVRMQILDPKLKGWSMEQLAQVLSSFAGLDRVVVDRTGLEGIYKITLNIHRRGGSLDGEAPDVMAALPSQLGLRLESRKEPVKVLVIDHLERPNSD
jgi:uncharacterized protein (TIGR03435 family)